MEKRSVAFEGRTEAEVELKFSRWLARNVGLVNLIQRHPIERDSTGAFSLTADYEVNSAVRSGPRG